MDRGFGSHLWFRNTHVSPRLPSESSSCLITPYPWPLRNATFMRCAACGLLRPPSVRFQADVGSPCRDALTSSHRERWMLHPWVRLRRPPLRRRFARVVRGMTRAAMTQADLVWKMAQGAGITARQAAQALRVLLERLQLAPHRGERVTLAGFGTFAARSRAVRKGSHPHTGQEIVVPAGKIPTFPAGHRLREAAVTMTGALGRLVQGGIVKEYSVPRQPSSGVLILTPSGGPWAGNPGRIARRAHTGIGAPCPLSLPLASHG
jgi:DNA-binding protein HU-beta